MSQQISNGRNVYQNGSNNLDTVSNLIAYAKQLLSHLRSSWKPPPNSKYKIWQEELIDILLRLSGIIEEIQTGIPEILINNYFSLLLYVGNSLSQFEQILPLVDRFIFILSSYDEVVQFYSILYHKPALQQLLSCTQLNPKSLLLATSILIKSPETTALAEPYLESLQTDFPSEVASIKVFLLLQRSTIPFEDRVDQAFSLMQEALRLSPKNWIVMFNTAYVSVLRGDKENAFNLIKAAMKINRRSVKVLLFLIRILRSNCQNNQVINIVQTSRFVFDRWNLHLCIEALYSSFELKDEDLMSYFFFKIQKHFPESGFAFRNLITFNILVGENSNASDLLKKWSEFDSQSADYFYSFAQISIAYKSYVEAEIYLRFAVGIDPSNVIFLISLSQVYSFLDNLNSAISCALNAVRLEPRNINAWIAYSNYLTGFEKDEAYQRIVELREVMWIYKI